MEAKENIMQVLFEFKDVIQIKANILGAHRCGEIVRFTKLNLT